jgi:hypothetical protein
MSKIPTSHESKATSAPMIRSEGALMSRMMHSKSHPQQRSEAISPRSPSNNSINDSRLHQFDAMIARAAAHMHVNY